MTKLYKLDGDIKREYTDEEYAQAELDKLESDALAAERLKKEQAKAAAEAKLVALGLDLDNLKQALGLQHNL